jgi:hypothetical protein
MKSCEGRIREALGETGSKNQIQRIVFGKLKKTRRK